MTNIKDEIARVLVEGRRHGLAPSLDNDLRIIMNDEDFASVVHELDGNLIPLIIDHPTILRGHVWLYATSTTRDAVERLVREEDEE